MTVVRPNSIAGINSITVQTGQALNIHDASGNLIRNITSSSGVSTFSSLHVGSGTTTNTQGISVGTGCSIVSDSANILNFYTNNSNRLRIDDNGKVLIATTTTSEAHANQDELIIGSSSDDANHGLTIVTPNDHYGTVAFSDGSGGTSRGLLEYNHSGDYMRIYTAASERLRIESGGRVNIVGICSAASGFYEGTAKVATTGKAIAMAMIFG